MKSVNT